MFKNKYDVYFIFSLTFILFLGIYLVFQHNQKKDLDEYLLVLKDKISSMISDKDDKAEFDKIFDDFMQRIENDSVSAARVEKLADKVIAIRKTRSKFTKDDLNKIFPSLKSNDSVNTVLFRFRQINSKDWQKLTSNFEKSFLRCDSMRVSNEQFLNLNKRLKKQIDIHARISEEIKRNSELAVQKFNALKKVKIDEEVEKTLLEEIEKLKMENERIHSKISSINEIQAVIKKERQKLQKQLQYIDSLKAVRL